MCVLTVSVSLSVYEFLSLSVVCGMLEYNEKEIQSTSGNRRNMRTHTNTILKGVLKGGKFVYPLLEPYLLEVDKVSYSIS